MFHKLPLLLLGTLFPFDCVLRSSALEVPSTYDLLPGVGYVEINSPNISDMDRTWFQAVDKCQREGGDLLTFESLEEIQTIREYIDFIYPSLALYWVGFHDLFKEGEFVSMKDRDISSGNGIKWQAGSPSVDTTKNCVLLDADNTLIDYDCASLRPSLCKIDFWKTYTHVAGVGFYQFYSEPVTWFEARKKCRGEGASLAVVNSEVESSVITLLAGPIKVFVGLHDLFNEGQFRTVEGLPLQDSGWNVFAAGEPSDSSGTENCLVIADGLLSDEDCNVPRPFVCEHGIN